jgi:acetoin utilization deacetylase AcuC-like enzyme
MSVLILTHPSSHAHVTPSGHPERVARIETVDQVLASDPYSGLPQAQAPAASDQQITRAHDAAYVEMIKASAPAQGWVSLDPDTHMCPDSLEAARHAAGSNIAAVEAVVGGRHKAAFCAVRPCGHHAEKNRAMGFCLFNNVAVGAHHALDALGVGKLAIVDFDVHHGNGTQDIA